MKKAPKFRRSNSYDIDKALITYIQYDVEDVKKKYNKISKKIMNNQILIDKANLTKTFEVDVDPSLYI